MLLATCSTETAEPCKNLGGYCGNPSSCPDNNVVDNKCPGGQGNKCCLGMPFQEAECEAAGGECGDRCECEESVLHNLCPSQPNSIKCCPKEESEECNDECSEVTCTSGLGSSCSNGVCTIKCGGTVVCSDLSCPKGLSTSCSNGNCKVDCKGGSTDNVAMLQEALVL